MRKNDFPISRLGQEINFEKLDGVVPVVVQDAKTHNVLMVGFMNEEAFSRTIESGKMWYYSRKRKTLWKKGEQSGNIQNLKKLSLDCDNDTLLAEVEQIGGACDLGYRSCFEKIWQANQFVPNPDAARVFDPSVVYSTYSEDLRLAVPTGSLERCTRDILSTAFRPNPCSEGEYYHTILPSFESIVIFIGHNPRIIPSLVASGKYDAGITGFDVTLEARASVVPIMNLGYNKRGLGAALWAVAIPDSSKIASINDLKYSKVVTELHNVTSSFFRQQGISVEVQPRCSGNHAKLFSGNPVVDLIETGETLRYFGYRPLAKVLVTHTVLIANPNSYGCTWKRRRIEALAENLCHAVVNLPVSNRVLYQFPTNLEQSSPGIVNWESYKRNWFSHFRDNK